MERWTCTIVQTHERKYYARLTIGGYEVSGLPGLPEHVSYRYLRNAILRMTGIKIPSENALLWEKLSDTEMIATIDTGRPVTLSERKGW